MLSHLTVTCPSCAAAMVFSADNPVYEGLTFDRSNCPPVIAGALHGATQECKYCSAEITLVVTCLVNTYYVKSQEQSP